MTGFLVFFTLFFLPTAVFASSDPIEESQSPLKRLEFERLSKRWTSEIVGSVDAKTAVGRKNKVKKTRKPVMEPESLKFQEFLRILVSIYIHLFPITTPVYNTTAGH